MVYEEQARSLVAKYGTARGPTGGEHWAPVTSVTLTPEAVLVLIGLVLLGIVLFAIVRDLFAARERKAAVLSAYEERKSYE